MFSTTILLIGFGILLFLVICIAVSYFATKLCYRGDGNKPTENEEKVDWQSLQDCQQQSLDM